MRLQSALAVDMPFVIGMILSLGVDWGAALPLGGGGFDACWGGGSSPMGFTNEGSQASFLFEISGLSTPTAVVDFSANEAISRPYSVTLTLLIEGDISQPDAVIGKEGVLTIVASRSEAGDAGRYFHGIIKEFEQSGHNGRHKFYRAELVPSLWRLSLRKNCRIFQEMNVQDIVKQILDEAGVASNRYRFSILNKERMRGFCVQYRETDYDFICRLLQEEGLFYFFQHAKDSHLLIISDDKSAHPAIKGGDCIPFNGSGLAANEDCISAFSFNKELGPQTFCHSNFNFKKPTLDLTARQSEGDSVQREIYDYPALHTTEERGNNLAKVRLEELVARQRPVVVKEDVASPMLLWLESLCSPEPAFRG